MDIIVACPGRLLDLYDQKLLSLNKIEMVVLDEADQMFDMGFLPAIRLYGHSCRTPDITLFRYHAHEIRALASEFKRPGFGRNWQPETGGNGQPRNFPVNHEQKLDPLLSLVRGAGEGQISGYLPAPNTAPPA